MAKPDIGERVLREMKRLGIARSDPRSFTCDIAGRLMFYGEDNVPRYVETGTRTPPGEDVVSPPGAVSPEVEQAMREAGVTVEFEK